MSRELLKHDKVTEYATVWMDTVRNGEFGLTNTNRLIRFYRGITGLKTGYTSNAGFCVSASAKRENLHLIAVVMGAESSQARNNAATKLLNYGFANYALYSDIGGDEKEIPISGGIKENLKIMPSDFEILSKRSELGKITREEIIYDNLTAPIKLNVKVGEIIYNVVGKEIGKADIMACETVDNLTIWKYIIKIIKNLL
jgi:D-alanyl-D-alanine carboxypeptidase (penicillin-binding protein 5/6)